MEKKPSNKLITTDRDFKKFVSFCKELMKRLRLDNWQVNFSHVENDDASAVCYYNLEQEDADLELATDWTVGFNQQDETRVNQKYVCDDQLFEDAYHEVLHLLLAPLADMAERYGAPKKEVKLTEHIIIFKLLGILIHGR